MLNFEIFPIKGFTFDGFRAILGKNLMRIVQYLERFHGHK